MVELALFLQRMGANIELSPDRRIVIEGVEKLKGASTRLAWLTASLEAFSYLVAGLITRGEVRVHVLPAGPPGHRDHHAGADGRQVRHHRRVDHRVGPGRAAGPRPCTPIPTRVS